MASIETKETGFIAPKNEMIYQFDIYKDAQTKDGKTVEVFDKTVYATQQQLLDDNVALQAEIEHNNAQLDAIAKTADVKVNPPQPVPAQPVVL